MNNLPSRLDRLTKRLAPPESPFVIELWVHVPGSAGIVENQATGERMSQEALAKMPGYFTLRIGDSELRL